MQKAIESKGLELINAEKVRTPISFKEVTDEQRESIEKVIEKFEEDDDVQQVFTNMA
jgi:transcriptional/translational regulatory protein YebC/TACO1